MMRLLGRGMMTGPASASRKAARVRAMVSGGGPSGTGARRKASVARATGSSGGGTGGLVLIAAPR